MSDTTETASSIEGEKEFVHPLLKNDPILVKHVDFVTLEFLERAKHPIEWMWWSLGKIVGLSIIGPIVAILPFVSEIFCISNLDGFSSIRQ